MSDRDGLSRRDQKFLFWASFLALAAAGFGFVFRVMLPDIWGREFNITAQEVGGLAGAALWPIAITMILFSLLVDRIGYRKSMFCAFALQSISVVLTIVTRDVELLWWACFFAGLGHGVVEAVINPLCASIYRDQKSKMLNILHAAWPGGIVGGGCIYLLAYQSMSWRIIFLFMLLPVLAYGAMFFMCRKFPVDERIEANVPMSDMLREFGGLGAFLAITFLFYEIANQIHQASGALTAIHANLLYVSLAVGAAGGAAFGYAVKAKGKILFFILCLIMVPLATAELATDGWIQTLMRPVLQADFDLHAGWAIVTSAFIMMTLRFFAGVPLKHMSPPALLLVSSLFSIAGLYLLSSATGALILLAFVLYAVGQTFYWPTMLGFVSERFPRGGAMTLNTVSAIGLLTVGIFGFPFLGAVKDNFDAQTVKQAEPALYETYRIADRSFFGWQYDSIKANEVLSDGSLSESQKSDLAGKIDTSARRTLKVAAVLPLTMAIAFGLILLWFKAQGGYQVVRLDRGEADDGGSGGGESW
jgi:MFS family permease